VHIVQCLSIHHYLYVGEHGGGQSHNAGLAQGSPLPEILGLLLKYCE
jgi:hypothetical protein